MGKNEGKPIDENIPIDQLMLSKNNQEENPEKFQQRVITAINYVLNNFAENSLIVSHGGVYYTLSRYMNWPIINLENCVPLHHTPPKEVQQSWLICNVKGLDQ